MSAPARFGRYRVERRIGSGAFATVWLARDEVLEAPVAVKVLADNWSHRLDIRARFEEEARILRRADSDRVVRVHDIGELEDGRPYFVMTYADRGTLAERIGDGPLPVADALRYGADIARGLAVLHQVGVIHRDVNPGNVLLHSGRDGDDAGERVLIADLGLAKAAARGSGFTLTVGTPGYTAPEQAKPGEVGLDKRADVYSIGAVLHHMLTGVQPEQDEVPVPPRQLRPEVPEPVDEVVRRALGRRPEDRFPSAGALADALDRAALRALEAPPRPRPALPPALISRPAPHRPEDPAPAEPTATGDAADDPGAAAAGTPDEEAERLAEDRPRGPEDTLTIAWPPPRRRGRLIAVLVVALVLLAGGGTATWLVLRTRADVGVQTLDGSVRLRVPPDWATQLRRSAWDTSAAGATGPPGTSLVVSSDVAAFDDEDSKVPGVFAGRAEGLTPEQALGQSAAGKCPEATVTRALTGSGLTGEVSRRRCADSPVAWVEAWLQPPSKEFLVYVQIREPADDDTAAGIVSSLVVDWR